MLYWNCAIVADVMLEMKVDDWPDDRHHLRKGISSSTIEVA